ncbi:hypothetical protein N0824_02950 [Microcystis sp. 0824]|nr:hypothetical protein N0824_02950 [Microcystis sp. 0824]
MDYFSPLSYTFQIGFSITPPHFLKIFSHLGHLIPPFQG